MVAPLRDRANRRQQLRVGGALDHEAVGARLDDGAQVGAVVVHGQGEHLHGDVDHDDVGPSVERALHGFGAVGGLRDDLHVLLTVDEHPQAGPQHGVVVREEHADEPR